MLTKVTSEDFPGSRRSNKKRTRWLPDFEEGTSILHTGTEVISTVTQKSISLTPDIAQATNLEQQLLQKNDSFHNTDQFERLTESDISWTLAETSPICTYSPNASNSLVSDNNYFFILKIQTLFNMNSPLNHIYVQFHMKYALMLCILIQRCL